MSHPCPISFKLIPMIPRNKGNHLLLNQLSCILLIFGVTQVFTATLNLTMQQQNDLELDQRKVLFFCFGSRTDRFVSTGPVLWNLDLKWCDTSKSSSDEWGKKSEPNRPLVIVVSPWAISAGCQFPLIRFFSLSCSCSWVALSPKSNDDIWLLFSLAFPRGTVQLNLTLSPSYVYLIEPPRAGDTCAFHSCCPQQTLTDWFINSHKCSSRVLLGFLTVCTCPK